MNYPLWFFMSRRMRSRDLGLLLVSLSKPEYWAVSKLAKCWWANCLAASVLGQESALRQLIGEFGTGVGTAGFFFDSDGAAGGVGYCVDCHDEGGAKAAACAVAFCQMPTDPALSTQMRTGKPRHTCSGLQLGILVVPPVLELTSSCTVCACPCA